MCFTLAKQGSASVSEQVLNLRLYDYSLANQGSASVSEQVLNLENLKLF